MNVQLFESDLKNPQDRPLRDSLTIDNFKCPPAVMTLADSIVFIGNDGYEKSLKERKTYTSNLINRLHTCVNEPMYDQIIFMKDVRVMVNNGHVADAMTVLDKNKKLIQKLDNELYTLVQMS